MDPDATLAWILRLKSAIDGAIERGDRPDPDEIYTLVGLVDELDGWLTEGRRPPHRWAAAFATAVGRSVVQLTGAADNDGATATPGRRRRSAVRRNRREAAGQLALPFAASGGLRF